MPALTVPTTPQAQRRAMRLIGLAKNELKPVFFQTISISKEQVDMALFTVERNEPDNDTIMSREVRRGASKDVSNFFKAIKSKFQLMLILVAESYMNCDAFRAWVQNPTVVWNTQTMVEFSPGEHTILFHFLSNLRVQMGIYCETWDYMELGCWMWQSQDNARILGRVLLQLVGYTIQHIQNGGNHSFSKPNNVGTNLNDVINELQSRRDYIGKQWKAPARMWQYRASMETHSNARRPYRLTSEDCYCALLAASTGVMRFPPALERSP